MTEYNVYEEADSRRNIGDMVFRKRYRQLTEDEVHAHDILKEQAVALYNTIWDLPLSREQEIALVKLEEAVMWAVKGLTA